MKSAGYFINRNKSATIFDFVLNGINIQFHIIFFLNELYNDASDKFGNKMTNFVTHFP